MRIQEATRRYEAWLGGRIRLLDDDLTLKHQRMAEAPFRFLRATFYRWAQIWPEVCPELARAPEVLAVGDLHVENFGTWRDIEGRLIWGINDLDEAYPMAYTNDLVRLAASARLAIAENHLALRTDDACQALLEGYYENVHSGGEAFVLAEHHHWLRHAATGELRDAVAFWKKMEALPTWRGPIPKGAGNALKRMLPAPGLDVRIAHRIAGLGSLGRERFVALAEWRGGKVAREAKALAPSACIWATDADSDEILYQEMLDRAVRVCDPFVKRCGRWLVRRLAPDCSRIELASLPKERDETRLLHAMGRETANLHLGTKGAAKAIRRDLAKRRPDWLHTAAKRMVKAVMDDWEEWRSAWAERA